MVLKFIFLLQIQEICSHFMSLEKTLAKSQLRPWRNINASPLKQ